MNTNTNINILAIDPGFKNMGLCYIKDKKIEYWDLIDLEINNDKTTKKLIETIILKLDSILEKINDIDIVLIETQPNKNPRMKIISISIHTYFSILKIRNQKIKEVKFTLSYNKLKCKKVTKNVNLNYRERKQLSIDTCLEYLKDFFIDSIEIFNKFKKKDDVADAFLYCIYYLENNTSFFETPQELVPRKKICLTHEIKVLY